MAEPITLGKLTDASVDADTLGEFANEDKLVVSRKGLEYPSAPMASRLLVENGLLGARPFSTYAKMTAPDADPPLVDGDYAIVTNDTEFMKNGFYQKINGQWTRLQYNYIDTVQKIFDKLAQYYNDSLTAITAITSSENVFEIADKNGNILFTIDKQGEIFAVGLERSLQSVASARQEQLFTQSDDLVVFSDENQNVYALIDSMQKMRLVGLNGSVQDCINHMSDKIYTPANRHSNYDLSTTANTFISNLRNKRPTICPPPINNLPQNFSLGTAWINDITLSQPTDYIVVESPYKGVKTAVHPSIAEFWGGMNGHRYYVALNPYGNSGEPIENPCLFGSNELYDFDLLSFVQQPLDLPSQSSQYLSDNHISYDPTTGEMLVIWRDSMPDVGDALWIRRSVDGIHFTDKKPLIPYTSRSIMGGLLSPSLLYNINDGLWYLYTVRTNGSLEYRTAAKLTGSLEDWSPHQIIIASDIAWHAEFKIIGDKVVALLNHRTNKTLQLAISSNWVDFTLSTNSNLLSAGDAPYKASFVPEYNNQGEIRLHVLWTSSGMTGNLEKNWLLYSAKTNYISI